MERDTGRPGPMTPDDFDLRLTDAPSDELRDVAGNGLLAFNVELLGSPNRRPLCIAIHARKDGKLLGGLYGRTGYRRLFVELLFVPSELRSRGLGQTLLRQAEAEAKARDCIGAWLETFSDDAKRFYLKNGYRVFGEIADYPPGNTRFFLSKDF